MLDQPFSQLELGFRDTVLHKAQNDEADALCFMYGFNRPRWIPATNWRQAVHHVAFGPRGTPQGLFRFLLLALQIFEDTFDVEVDGGTAAYSFEATSGTPFTNKHVGRYVRLVGPGTSTEEHIYYASAPADIDTPGSSVITLSSVGTTQFEAAPAALTQGTYKAHFLPFLLFELTPGVRFSKEAFSFVLPDGTVQSEPPTPYDTVGPKEDACLIEIWLFGFDKIFTFPATYVQTDHTEAFVPSVLQGGPTGGYIQEDEFEPQYDATGPVYPIYLGDGESAISDIKNVMDMSLVAAGVRTRFKIKLLYNYPDTGV
jgi:hypothetical protein